ncbi:aldo/keto reductase [Corallococcus sp. 4LFB]|uniref:aldo/keto reductase n=1 Tax=Corallococcus sp. 4LFB TaxID=3383249 RepID=UPI0039753064
MKRRRFGWTGIEVPVVGQGTWELELVERDTALAVLRRGIELGMSHIDTAELYGDGQVEALVAEVIGGSSSLRSSVYLVSKVLAKNATRQGTLAACEGSLRRLKTSYLDLYLLHSYGEHPLEETISALEELVRAGKIRAWGVSNFNVRKLEEALRIAGPRRIACNQVMYHPHFRAIERSLIPLCAANEIAVVAHTPFGDGRFPEPTSPAGLVIEELAREYGVSVRQVVLVWLMRHSNVFTIPKTTQLAHVEDNANAGGWTLTSEDMERLTRSLPEWQPATGRPA